MREYQIKVGGVDATLVVPYDFDRGVDEAFYATYFPDLYAQAWKDPPEFYRLLNLGGHIQYDNAGHGFMSPPGATCTPATASSTSTCARATCCFVDRFSYNFISPKPGDPFVFHTGGIPDLKTTLPDGTVVQMDEYYIKRLVGAPGDVLEVRPPALYRNGAPNTGAAAFDKNARQEGNYPGYTNGDPGNRAQYLFRGQTFTVPDRLLFCNGRQFADQLRQPVLGPRPGAKRRRPRRVHHLSLYLPLGAVALDTLRLAVRRKFFWSHSETAPVLYRMHSSWLAGFGGMVGAKGSCHRGERRLKYFHGFCRT